MKKSAVIFLLFFLLSCNIYSQDYFRAVYSLEYKLDTANKKINKEFFNLYFDKEQSYYSAEPYFENSILKGTSTLNTSSFQRKTIFNGRIITKRGIFCRDYLSYGRNYFFYEEEFPKWKMLSTSRKINGMECQDATTHYLGREWKVCFSSDYPFQYGPYKFHGLPGLIIDVEDEKGLYHFQMIEFKKIDALRKFDANKIEGTITVDKRKYFQLLSDRLYSTKILEDTMSNVVNQFSAEQMKEYNKTLQQRKKERNNFPIDKDVPF